jgi:molybdate transport system ATP-binding protein
LASAPALQMTLPPHRASVELEVQIRKRYGRASQACFQLEANFQAARGVTILLGHSGAGKTTLLHCVAGLCNPEHGHIAIGRQLLFDSAKKISVEPSHRKVAFVFQDLALFPHLTVQQNVAYGLRRLSKPERDSRITRILESFRIAHLRKRLPSEISAGERQRVALARSLVTEPSVLLLDEPLSSLDVRTKAGIINDLKLWNEDRGVPLLYVTHDHSEVFALGERVLLLDKGAIVADGSPLDLLPIARNLKTENLDFENVFDATVSHVYASHVTCRPGAMSSDLTVAPAPALATPGTKLRLGIRASDIALSAAPPRLLGAWNALPARVTSVSRSRGVTEARVHCGTEWVVHLPAATPELDNVAGADVWLMIRPEAFTVIHSARPKALQRLFLFVCGGNTNRSPIAQAICSAEIARRLKLPFDSLEGVKVRAASAGLSADVGEPISTGAHDALARLGIERFQHRARSLTADLIDEAEAVFCMTAQQQQRAVELFPWAAAKIQRLSHDVDLEEPRANAPDEFLALARQIRSLVQCRLDEFAVREG